jgi:hypothetical protein
LNRVRLRRKSSVESIGYNEDKRETGGGEDETGEEREGSRMRRREKKRRQRNGKNEAVPERERG